MERTGGTRFMRVQRGLKRTRRYRGQTGTIAIDPATGYRLQLPFLNIITRNSAAKFVIVP